MSNRIRKMRFEQIISESKTISKNEIESKNKVFDFDRQRKKIFDFDESKNKIFDLFRIKKIFTLFSKNASFFVFNYFVMFVYSFFVNVLSKLMKFVEIVTKFKIKIKKKLLKSLKFKMS